VRGAVLYFRELLFKSNKKKLSFRRDWRLKRLAVIQEEICCSVAYVSD